MNNTIKQYILELLEYNDLEMQYVIQAIDNNKMNDSHPTVVATFTKESLLKKILKVINNVEDASNGI